MVPSAIGLRPTKSMYQKEHNPNNDYLGIKDIFDYMTLNSVDKNTYICIVKIQDSQIGLRDGLYANTWYVSVDVDLNNLKD